MQVATCRLKLNQKGSDIPLAGVTPAEVLVLRKGHEMTAGGEAIFDVKVIGNASIKSSDEIQRLRAKYASLRIKDGDKDINVVAFLFPGHGIKLPETFEEIGLPSEKGEYKGPETYNPLPDEEKHHPLALNLLELEEP